MAGRRPWANIAHLIRTDLHKLKIPSRAECKFVSAGREDADVRMLGAGRPFYIELINPRSPQQEDRLFPIIQEEINTSPDASAVMVRHLLSVEE